MRLRAENGIGALTKFGNLRILYSRRISEFGRGCLALRASGLVEAGREIFRRAFWDFVDRVSEEPPGRCDSRNWPVRQMQSNGAARTASRRKLLFEQSLCHRTCARNHSLVQSLRRSVGALFLTPFRARDRRCPLDARMPLCATFCHSPRTRWVQAKRRRHSVCRDCEVPEGCGGLRPPYECGGLHPPYGIAQRFQLATIATM